MTAAAGSSADHSRQSQTQARDITGRHDEPQPAWIVWLTWTALFIWGGGLIYTLVRFGRLNPVTLVVFLVLIGCEVFRRRTGLHTEVGADRLVVSVSLGRTMSIAWGDVLEAEPNSTWNPASRLAIRTRQGVVPLFGLHANRGSELIAYARDHSHGGPAANA